MSALNGAILMVEDVDSFMLGLDATAVGVRVHRLHSPWWHSHSSSQVLLRYGALMQFFGGQSYE